MSRDGRKRWRGLQPVSAADLSRLKATEQCREEMAPLFLNDFGGLHMKIFIEPSSE